MQQMTAKYKRYDGRTVEYSAAPTGGFTFLIWGAEYSYNQAAPLVRAGKRTDGHFRRVLEQHSDPTLVDILLAQETLTNIYRQLKPIGRPQ